MDINGYMKWVEYIANNGIKPPRVLFKDLESWMTKLTIARFLARRGYEQYKPALEIMETILEENLNEFKQEDDITYEEFIETKIWTLMDIGELYFIIEGDAAKGLKYLNQSLELAESVDYSFDYLVRGEIWKAKLKFLVKVEGIEAVMDDIKNKIRYYEDIRTTRSNSYLFNAYKMSADIEKDKGDYGEAINYLKTALKYFPLENSRKTNLDEIWEARKENLVNAYKQMEELTFYEVVWDI